MSETLRVCLYDGKGSNKASLKEAFERVRNLHILSEVATWDDLKDWIQHANVHLVAINLDDGDGQGLEMVQRLTDHSPGCAIIGVSRKSDPSSIIKAMRAGCSQFVCWPIEQDDLKAAIDRIRSSRMVTPQASKRVCVVGSAGGAGATTIACNLAIEFGHLSERRSALVDLNLEFGDVNSAFDCAPRFSVADICHEGVEIDRVLLASALFELPCNVSILARPESIQQARQVTPEGVEKMLRIIGEMFPYIVIDLPRTYGFLSIAALREVDYVLIVTQLAVPFIRNATRIYQNLMEMGVREETVQIVINRCKANFERITPTDVESHFNRPVFATIPNDYRHVQASLDFGHPIMADAPSSPSRVAIHEMARKIAGLDTGEKASQPGTGFLGKFWKRSAKAKAKN